MSRVGVPIYIINHERGQSDGVVFSVEIPFSQMGLVYDGFTNKLTSTTGHAILHDISLMQDGMRVTYNRSLYNTNLCFKFYSCLESAHYSLKTL